MVIQVGERISGKKLSEFKDILRDLETLHSKMSSDLHPMDEKAEHLLAELGTLRNRLFRHLEL